MVLKEAESLRRVLREIEDDIHALEKQRDEKAAAAATDFGPERAFFALQDECVERQVEQYTYKFCAFKDVKQDYTLLGKWDGWDDAPGHTRMRFTGGQKCWNGPERYVVSTAPYGHRKLRTDCVLRLTRVPWCEQLGGRAARVWRRE